jgi:hypothetical protein
VTRAAKMLGHLAVLERALVVAGWEPLSPWWWATLRRFYESSKRQLVLRVGRRGRKSTTLTIVALLEALFGAHTIAPGDVGLVAILSVDRKEAARRLRTVKAVLDALRVPYVERGDTIELCDRPFAFTVMTASLGGVVGGTVIVVIADEVARWNDDGVNPAHEVLSSLAPAQAGQRHAVRFLSSSPLSSVDAHAVAFDAGETPLQCVAYAETWTANPKLSEDELRLEEPNPRIFDREYRAVPQGASVAIFASADVDFAIGRNVPSVLDWTGKRRMVIDGSRGGDAFTWGVCRWLYPSANADETITSVRTRKTAWNEAEERFDYVEEVSRDYGITWERRDPMETPSPVLVFEDVGTVPNARDAAHSVSWLVGKCNAYARIDWDGADAPIDLVVADQFEAGALAALFSQASRGRIRFRSLPWTAPSKAKAADRAERWMRERRIALPALETLRKQLHEYSERATKSGALVLGGRGKHDDHAALVMTAAHASLAGLLDGDPDRYRNIVHEDARPTPGAY